jgi:hypothetical protein
MTMARKYGKKASEKVKKSMHEFKRGKLKTGSGKKVTSRKQAIAIGLSQARRAGGKVPPAHAVRGLDDRVRTQLSNMRPDQEIDARGMARVLGSGFDPLDVDYALQRAEKLGLASTRDGKWFSPTTVRSAHATRKSEDQLDAEIAEVVPGWAKGLDMTESRRLAKTLHRSQEDLDRMERAAESTRIAALPSLKIDARTGKDPGSTTARGVYIWISSPGIAYGNNRKVESALRSEGFKIDQMEPRYVRVVAQDNPSDVAQAVMHALHRRGYRVEFGRPR